MTTYNRNIFTLMFLFIKTFHEFRRVILFGKNLTKTRYVFVKFFLPFWLFLDIMCGLIGHGESGLRWRTTLSLINMKIFLYFFELLGEFSLIKTWNTLYGVFKIRKLLVSNPDILYISEHPKNTNLIICFKMFFLKGVIYKYFFLNNSLCYN